jgi:hypothetical protein
MTTAAQITDEEIRDWARSTGRPVGAKGRVAAPLRAEYEQLAAEAAAHPPADPGPPPAIGDGRGAESDSAAPGPAQQETPPRRVRSASTRLRARVWGSPGTSGRKRKSGRPRVSTEKFIERTWETAARILQPVNLPVARCLDWQAPTAGALLEEAVRDTIADRFLQPVARVEDKLEIAGALIGPPVLIFALQLPGNQPVREVEVTGPDGQLHRQQVPWPAGAMRQQVIMSALVEALDMCMEAQEKLPAEVRERQRHREERRKAMRELVQDVFFAPPPASAEAAQAEEEAMARARERYRGA